MSFYKGKRVLVTGHTGFKGCYFSRTLTLLGAEVFGYALPPDEPSLYTLCGMDKYVTSVIGDVRDMVALSSAFENARPELVVHMAAQPLVREGYASPLETYETNVMGTVHVLECVRTSGTVKSFLNVTTDKVYHNHEWQWGYRETDALGGLDPYSNSKACSDIITQGYAQSFLNEAGVAVSTARAGNVIGGGDFAKDRIIPDCMRAAQQRQSVRIRNPHSVRPYQHVLEALYAYLLILQKQYENPALAGWYNVGPGDADCLTTGELAKLFCTLWGEGMSYEITETPGPRESGLLKLDCAQIQAGLGWQPQWDIRTALEKTVEWTRAYLNGGDVGQVMDKQIRAYFHAIG